jgi:hypothetical protein
MKTTVCALLAVLVIGSAAMAAPGYIIENATFDPAYLHMGAPKSVFYFDVVTAGFDVPILSPGVGVGANLGGDLTGITADNLLNQYIPEADFYPALGVIGPTENWAWDAFAFESSNSAIIDDGGNEVVTFQLVQGNPTGVSVDNGMVIARIFYAWDGTGLADPSLVEINVQGPNPGEANPFLLTVASDPTGGGDPVELPLIPEPATMGLLSLGLVGLFARRRNK